MNPSTGRPPATCPAPPPAIARARSVQRRTWPDHDVGALASPLPLVQPAGVVLDQEVPAIGGDHARLEAAARAGRLDHSVALP